MLIGASTTHPASRSAAADVRVVAFAADGLLAEGDAAGAPEAGGRHELLVAADAVVAHDGPAVAAAGGGADADPGVDEARWGADDEEPGATDDPGVAEGAQPARKRRRSYSRRWFGLRSTVYAWLISLAR